MRPFRGSRGPLSRTRSAALNLAFAVAAALLASCAGAPAAPPAPVSTAPVPPVAAMRPHAVASPNGTRADPYYWLRDDTRRDPDVLAYLDAENAYAAKVMAPLKGLEDKLYAEIAARIVPDDTSAPRFEGGYWYYEREDAGHEYPVVVRRKGTMTAPEEMLVDGNQLAQGEGYFALGGYAVSPDGTRLAYVDDHVGRRQYTLHIKNLATGETLPDAVPNLQEDIAWLGDNRSVLYVERDPVTLLGQMVNVHVAGTAAGDDRTVYSEKDDTFYLQVSRSRFDRYVYIHAESTESSEWLYADARTAKPKFQAVLPREPKHLYYVEDLGDDFIIRTNWQAPNFRIVAVPVAQAADKRRWRNVVATRSNVLLEGYEAFDGALAVNERTAGVLRLRIVSLDGRADHLIDSSEPTYANLLQESRDPARRAVRYLHTTLDAPDATFEFDLKSGASRLLKQDQAGGGFDASRYTSDLLMAPARDGRYVPISVVRRKDTPLDGTAPLYQTGYGAYGWSTDPEFEGAAVSLLDRGFVVAIAHVRGGQELGRTWYDEGRLLNKRNTFTDFIDSTDFLVAQGYAARDKVFAHGASAGGLLMGAVANLAPEKYRGITADVPFVDVVTTMLDASIPLTTNEFDEWGDPRVALYYDYMMSYSPYDNVRRTAYPALFVTTGLMDSQVQYYEPAKWVAKLRANKTDDHPLVLRVNMEAGHGGESGRYRGERETAAEYAFILGQIGIRE